jgi:hypothetical protein
MKSRSIILNLLLVGLLTQNVYASDELKDLELLEDEDINILLEDDKTGVDLDLSRLEEIDDLEALKKDVGGSLPDVQLSKENKMKLDALNDDEQSEIDSLLGTSEKKELKAMPKMPSKKGIAKKPSLSKPVIFDAGLEEKKLLDLAKFVEKKIPAGEWDEISTAAKVEKYVVQDGDWLWKISQRLFGSGFYYSKIWSMNPQITNPHEIEPGQVLVFDTGSSEDFPKVAFGSFETPTEESKEFVKQSKLAAKGFAKYGDDVLPPWLEERQRLAQNGAFFQGLTDSTYADVMEMSATELNEDYKNYDPPISEISIIEPDETYDEDGVDRTTKLTFKVKEGFYLNTFLTTNHVQDLGKIVAKKNESVYMQKGETIYLEFDKAVKVRPGDFFTIYEPEGKVTHPVSDREGFKYTTKAQVKAIRQIEDKWEVKITELSGLIQRGARVTVYTPKINKIFQTFNKRNIEAALIGTYKDQTGGISMGDVVYLDRGRVDGVELGNVFEVYSFKDEGTGKRISNNPTYIVGEVVVITLTDNFATALVRNSSTDISKGAVALSKTEEKALREAKIRQGLKSSEVETKERLGLEELDVELNLDDLSQDLLERIDEVQINEDELEELERQEREKSIIKDHEKDLKELERLEKELVDAETKLNEKKVDEDAYLESQDLESIEKNAKSKNANAFESMDELESEFGKKYMDEDLNSKENPYGLTEFDLEEIDELLNTGAN